MQRDRRNMYDTQDSDVVAFDPSEEADGMALVLSYWTQLEAHGLTCEDPYGESLTNK